MIRRDAFSDCHPAVNLVYFALVLLVTMCVIHPAYLAASLVSTLIYNTMKSGWKVTLIQLWQICPIALFTAVLMPLFCREGDTVLFFLPSGGALTLESVCHGTAMAVMLMAVLLWFSCYNHVMTSDKLLYLFGKKLPAMTLLLSMTLRFVPKCRAQVRAVTETQQCVGRGIAKGDVGTRMKNAVAILAIVVTWALEDAVETADSIKSRGYGLPERTAFTIYRMNKRDCIAAVWLAFCGVYLLVGALAGGMSWAYYPTVSFALAGLYPLSILVVYMALCLTPVFMIGQEIYAWKYLKSAT